MHIQCAYFLATTEQVVRWYKVPIIGRTEPGGYELLDKLDLTQIQGYGDKDTAKSVALALGLKTWRYVRL